MRTATELLQAYVSHIDKPSQAALLFAENGAIELPYLQSLGMGYRTEGKVNIEKMLTGLLKQAPAFKFKNVNILIETPEQVFAEYEVDTLFNGKPYKQLYMGRLVAQNGEIKLLREGMDSLAVANLKK